MGLGNPSRDIAEPDIIKALVKAGFTVWDRLPVDLLTWRTDKGFKLLEVKTPDGKGRRRKRADQQAQDAFIEMTGTKVVLDPEQALRALGAIQS